LYLVSSPAVSRFVVKLSAFVSDFGRQQMLREKRKMLWTNRPIVAYLGLLQTKVGDVRLSLESLIKHGGFRRKKSSRAVYAGIANAGEVGDQAIASCSCRPEITEASPRLLSDMSGMYSALASRGQKRRQVTFDVERTIARTRPGETPWTLARSA